MSDSTPYSVPKEPGRWRAIFLAAVVHAALLAFLWIGIRWQNETPTSVDAEVWDLKQKEAAPVPQLAPPPPAPTPPPVQKEEPKPVVKEPPKMVTPPVENPDIAIEREKKRQHEVARKREEDRQEKLAEDRRERVDAEKQAAKLREKQQAETRAAQAKIAEDKRKDDQRKEDQRDKKLADEKHKKQLAEDLQKKQVAADAKAADERRKQDLSRLQNQANAGSGGSGNAARSQGARADSSYVSRVGAKIKSNTAYSVPDDLSENSAVEYSVELLPDGSVRSANKVKSSGIPGFDEAVARAIQKSAPYPPDKNGSVPSSFTLVHRPKDSRP